MTKQPENASTTVDLTAGGLIATSFFRATLFSALHIVLYMKRSSFICLIALFSAGVASARNWTNTQGKKVDAEVVKVHPDKTVELKTKRGKTVTVPFNTFVEADVKYLENLLAQTGRENLHPVPWSKLNDLLGMQIWQDEFLWDDPTEAVAKRTELRKESKTDFMENYRSYPLGRKKVLGQPVYTIALYGGREHAESIAFIFLNLGDMPPNTNPKNMAELIERTGKHMHAVLEGVLGKPERDSLGKGELREKVWRWDWNGHAIMLSLQDGKYTAMRIMPTARADSGGQIAKLSDDALKKRMASCIERRENGDVVVGNIPMIDQGPKGYCSPATWERYLRYLEIPADMYLLALAADTGVGGGTTYQGMVDAAQNIISSNGRKLSTSDTTLSIKKISSYIDKGLPIMWSLVSSPEFQEIANNTTAKHNGKEIGASGQTEDSEPGGHICLIIGYNKKNEEVAISDSWGSQFTERWVPLTAIQNASIEEAMLYRGDVPTGNTTTVKRPWSVIKW